MVRVSCIYPKNSSFFPFFNMMLYNSVRHFPFKKKSLWQRKIKAQYKKNERKEEKSPQIRVWMKQWHRGGKRKKLLTPERSYRYMLFLTGLHCTKWSNYRKNIHHAQDAKKVKLPKNLAKHTEDILSTDVDMLVLSRQVFKRLNILHNFNITRILSCNITIARKLKSFLISCSINGSE